MKLTLNIMYNRTIQNELLNYIRYGEILADNTYITKNNHSYRFMVVKFDNKLYEIERVDGDFTRVEIMNEEV